MLRLIGALLVAGAAARVGFGAARRLGERVEALRGFIAALGFITDELSCRLTPMPELLGRLRQEGAEAVRPFFAACERKMNRLGDVHFSEIWSSALTYARPALNVEDQQTLLVLGRLLGCYELEAQLRGLGAATRELTRALERAESDRLRLGRLYRTLGLGAGAMLVLILL